MRIAPFIVCLSLLAGPLVSSAEQENFYSVLKKIQNSFWVGEYRVSTLGGLLSCNGPLDVRFFPMTVEKFSQGVPTVSYRHHADFSHYSDFFCHDVVGGLSPVAVGQCAKNFPRKFNALEGKKVPFRTIIPRNGGESAVVNSPECKDDTRTVERKELELARLELSEDGQTLWVTIAFKPFGPIELSEFTYVLHPYHKR